MLLEEALPHCEDSVEMPRDFQQPEENRDSSDSSCGEELLWPGHFGYYRSRPLLLSRIAGKMRLQSHKQKSFIPKLSGLNRNLVSPGIHPDRPPACPCLAAH